jgi:hypothetical protein
MINLADFTLSSFVNPFVIMVALALGVISFRALSNGLCESGNMVGKIRVHS